MPMRIIYPKPARDCHRLLRFRPLRIEIRSFSEAEAFDPQRCPLAPSLPLLRPATPRDGPAQAALRDSIPGTPGVYSKMELTTSSMLRWTSASSVRRSEERRVGK